MGRPRTPSNVLELRGSFKTHPERRREDLAGVGAFNPMPPPDLLASLVPYWKKIVDQINPVVLTASDVSSVSVMARILCQFELTGDLQHAKELRQWFAQFGMTPVGRTKIAAPKKGPGGNPYADA